MKKNGGGGGLGGHIFGGFPIYRYREEYTEVVVIGSGGRRGKILKQEQKQHMHLLDPQWANTIKMFLGIRNALDKDASAIGPV